MPCFNSTHRIPIVMLFEHAERTEANIETSDPHEHTKHEEVAMIIMSNTIV